MTDPPATQVIDWESRYRDGAHRLGARRPKPQLRRLALSGVLAPCRILVPGGRPQPRTASSSPRPLRRHPRGRLPHRGRHAARTHGTSARQGTGRCRRTCCNGHPPAPFDAIYDQACLVRSAPAIWPDYAARLAPLAASPWQTLYILFMQSTRAGVPPSTATWDAMRALFPASALDLARHTAAPRWTTRPALRSNPPCCKPR